MRSALAALGLLVLLFGAGFWIITNTGGCAAALDAGTLVARGDELFLDEDVEGGIVRPIRWPLGFGVRRTDGTLVVTDLIGNVKAREGDHVALPGGETASNGPWGVCGIAGAMDDLHGPLR